MPYSEVEAKFLGPGKELTREPCYKKLKPAADDGVSPLRGGPDIHRIQEKPRNNRIAVATINFRRRICPQEDKTSTDVLKPLHKEMPGDKLGGSESIGSPALQDGKPSPLARDDEIYSTSKAFIGPIYKPPEKKKCRERKSETDTFSSIDSKRRQEEKQKSNSKKLEMDTELSQFYKEIEELENENEASQGSCTEPEPSKEPIISYDWACNTLKSEEANKDLSDVLQSHCGYHEYLEDEPDYPCDEQLMPAFCETSFPSFRPEWQSMHPFVIPHDPLSSFNYFNFQRFGTPLHPSPDVFHGRDDSQMQDGCHVVSYQDGWSCLTFDQNDCDVTSNNVHPFRNGCSVQDESVNNGFCEIRECWQDPSMDKHNETDRFVNQWFQEEKLNKLQKLLILLRGLPGSGKTTLSRILLGQSRDGIVFSTDDYFHHQDGYRYNVNQLGDAHDWNQNRAKQAIDQGRSPVIIDNTNTQAWEMKPYVEMAIGKGYRVEFHEPETWWKFDPEELEKRNKHGVSRKKIAQMLDRYEFQMSISIVMNSVEPTQKSIQRPLPLEGEQRGRVLKKSGYRFDKTKQKRNGTRKKRHNGFSENSLETLGHLAPGGQGPSQREGEGTDEVKREPWSPLTGGLQNEAADCGNGREEQSWQDRKILNSFQNTVSTVELDHTPRNCSPKEEKEERGSFLTLPSVPPASRHTSTQHLSCAVRDGCSGVRVGQHLRNRHNSALDSQGAFAKARGFFMEKIEVKDKSLPDEFAVNHQRGTRMSEEVLRKEQGVRNDCWAFFTASLCDEDSQLRSESQPYLGSWPEGPHKFVCEQRPKKARSRRLTCPDIEEQFVKLISTSEGATGSESSPEIPTEKKLLTDLSPKAETVGLPRNLGTDISSSRVPHLNSPEHPLESMKGTQPVQREICNLPPDSKLLGQTHINPEDEEKCDLLTESHGLNTFPQGKGISDIINKDERKQEVVIFDRHLPWFYLDNLLYDSPLSMTGKSCSYRLSFNRLGCAVYFYKNPVPSLTLHYLSAFCIVSLNNKRTLLTFKSQERVNRTLTDGGFIPSEVVSSRPDTVSSLRISSDRQFSNESFDGKLKMWETWEPVQCGLAEDSQNISRNGQSFGPLAQEFAFQPAKLLGSPGVAMEPLLPDDPTQDSL
uniref:NEDD4-binding protein 2-like 2 n=1 Tax=Mus spicilegus TaxID=10103 RepID=A0A8C6HSQ4_MUSSI